MKCSIAGCDIGAADPTSVSMMVWKYLRGLLIAKPMPKTRKGRSNLLLRNSSDYIRRMTKVDIDKLMLSLSKTQGLSSEDTDLERDALYNVDWKFLPEHLKE